MDETSIQHSSAWRALWLVALIGLPALGWYGVLDRFSADDINASISNAGLIYGTARGINALVSVLQGTQLNIPFVTFSIGEVLDPVNDLIERFSDLILIALGSLALQKMLLAIVSQTIFNILLTATAAVTGLCLFLGNPKLLSTLLRSFLLIAFFRFSLGLVVLGNNWVDNLFLNEADQRRHAAMEHFQGELRQIDTVSKKAEVATQLFTDAQGELAQLQRTENENNRALQTLQAKIGVSQSRLEEAAATSGRLCALSIRTPVLSPTCSDSVEKQSSELDQRRAQEKSIQIKQEAIAKKIEEVVDKMDCLDKRRRGETCSFWDVLPEAPNITVLQNKLKEMEAQVSDFAQNTISLLVSLLLKTVAIPLLFIYLLLKVVRMNWARLSTSGL